MKRLHYFFVNACLAMLGRAALHAPLASAQTPSQDLAMAKVSRDHSWQCAANPWGHPGAVPGFNFVHHSEKLKRRIDQLVKFPRTNSVVPASCLCRRNWYAVCRLQIS